MFSSFILVKRVEIIILVKNPIFLINKKKKLLVKSHQTPINFRIL